MWKSQPIRLAIGTEPGNQDSLLIPYDVLYFYSRKLISLLRIPRPVTQTLPLPNEDKRTLRLFDRWVNHRSFKLQEHEALSLGLLINLWSFGDRNGIPMMQNAIVDFLIQKMVNSCMFLTPDVIGCIFHHTPKGSKLQHMVIQILGQLLQVIPGWEPENPSDPKEVMEGAEVLNREGPKMFELGKELSQFQEPQWRCFWHVHAKGEDCTSERDA